MFFDPQKIKKILIIIPHQDDEINLMGGFLPFLIQHNIDIFVCYITNGAARYNANLRKQEAISALSVLKVPKDNVFFLNFQDGRGPAVPPELTKQLKSLIETLHPDAIFATDKDNHVDHIMTSNAIDTVILELNHAPAVFKGFAYSTAFEATKDYYHWNLLSTQKPKYLAKTEVPYYWDLRIRFPVANKATIIPLKNNLLFKAICCHRCQLLRIESSKIINGDAVFWQVQGHPIFSFAKLLIDDNFTYEKYYIYHEISLHLKPYTYGLKDSLQIIVDGNPLEQTETKLNLENFPNQKTINIKLVSKNNPDLIYDEVQIKRLYTITIIMKKIHWLLDHFNNYCHYKFDKLFKYKR